MGGLQEVHADGWALGPGLGGLVFSVVPGVVPGVVAVVDKGV